MAILRSKTVKLTDKRVALMNEVLTSIRLIKMYAWEPTFEEKVKAVRQDEVKLLRKAAMVQSLITSITPSVTIMAIVVTFYVLTASGFQLSSTTAFTLFSIFTALQFTVGSLPYALRAIGEAKVSLNRLQRFLLLPEYERSSPKEDMDDKNEKGQQIMIRMKTANMAWVKPPKIEGAAKTL